MLPDASSRLMPLLALLATVSLLSGCYLLQAAAGHAELMRRSVPIDDLLARPDTARLLRERLATVQQVLAYATGELGLPDNGSYRSYSDLERPYATWNVFVAGEFDARGRRWCFPVAGCVSYRGYFSEARAERYAARYAARGDDTFVGPSLAYSTLGHFRDPVLNTMLDQDDAGLASLLFHELAHQAAWRPGDADFNEAFATVVELEATRRWLSAQDRAAELEAYERAQRRQAVAAARMTDTRNRLASLYGSALAAAEMREAKQAEFGRLREWLGELDGGRQPVAGELNNARLLAVSTYHRCVPALQAQLQSLGGELPAFYAWARGKAGKAAGRESPCGD